MKLRPFAKLQTAQDNEDFVDGLVCESSQLANTQNQVLNHFVVEQTLRKRITELQDIRKKGITSFAEVDVYFKMKQARV
jgi:transcriptional adapter 2-alpha